MRTALLLLASLLALSPALSQSTERWYLSGTDKDHTVDWEFFVTGGRQHGEWTTIPVPSNWEFHGFGTYNYGHDTPRADEQGQYRHRFEIPAAWEGRNVQIVFEGSMTDTEVRINGEPAGPIHQGAFTEFRYDVSGLLAYGTENVLEVTVSKESSNDSVNEAERQADFWIFGGIYRPVYLEARPAEHLLRVAIDARADGVFTMDVYPGGLRAAGEVVAQIRTLEGEPIGGPFSAEVRTDDERVRLETRARGIEPWSSEWPHRYQVEITLRRDEEEIHTIREKFGFRTVELRPGDGIYVNGVRVHLKGVNHHNFWPESGRTSSREVSERDVQLIRDMNMNAVRMSHYPPDRHFIEVCDSLGLFVLDELTGWQDAYDTAVGEKLVRELVIRDVNSPSVILWDNGNEGGFNYELVDDYAIWDPQNRPVIHPWERDEGVINSTHYRPYDCCAGMLYDGREIILPTEFLHGLYDGGHGAGLQDWWNRMLQHPLAAGGFLWAFADEAVVRTDSNGVLDADGNHGPDGIVGPYREKEGSFFAIKEIWAPVHFEWSVLDVLPPSFDGTLRVENRFYYTDLSQCTFEWRLARFPRPEDGARGHEVLSRGVAPSPSIAPWQRGVLELELPDGWREADALYVTATGPHGRELYTWSWMIQAPEHFTPAAVPTSTVARLEERDGRLVLQAGSTEAGFDPATGQLVSVRRDGQAVSFTNGPRLIEGDAELEELTHYADGGDQVIEARYAGDLRDVTWRLSPDGWLRLDYSYENPGRHDHLGVSFDFPESSVRGIRWLGRGPYRVWKNRRQGVTFDVWEKAYNDSRTGETWEYPEFKGHHASLYWAIIETTETPITVVSGWPGLFLRLFTPANGVDPSHTAVPFPEGDISFLHGIAPIGTKFHPAEALGPDGQPNLSAGQNPTQNMGLYRATLYFYFGTPPSRAEL